MGLIAVRKVNDDDRKMIRELFVAGRTAKQIADALRIDGRVVSGVIARIRLPLLRGRGKSLPHPPPPVPFPTKQDQLKALAKSWRESEPEAEFSLHTDKGQKVYIACHKGGVVLRVGEQKKVALLTSGMASRLGLKLGEMAQWSAQIR